MYLFNDNRVLIVPYSQQYINTSLATLGKLKHVQLWTNLYRHLIFSLVQQNSIFKVIRQMS